MPKRPLAAARRRVDYCHQPFPPCAFLPSALPLFPSSDANSSLPVQFGLVWTGIYNPRPSLSPPTCQDWYFLPLKLRSTGDGPKLLQALAYVRKHWPWFDRWAPSDRRTDPPDFGQTHQTQNRPTRLAIDPPDLEQTHQTSDRPIRPRTDPPEPPPSRRGLKACRAM